MKCFYTWTGQTRYSIVWVAVSSLFFSCFSCGSSSIEMQIQNSTSTEIQNIEISNHNKELTTNTFSLAPGEKLTKQLDFSHASVMDGSYLLSIGTNQRKSFGYYTNGLPLEKGYHLEIKADTVIINSF